jgi:RNA polymerase sigma-70 factor (ECF subfamily)
LQVTAKENADADGMAMMAVTTRPRRRVNHVTTLPLSEVVSAAQSGDEQAIGELYRRTARRTRAAARCYCAPADAEDAASEGFVRALSRLHQLRDPSAAEAWIARCAVRAAIDLSRRQRRQQPSIAALEWWNASGHSESAAERALSAVERDSLAAVIRQLPDPPRLLLRLRYDLGWSIDRIARFLDVPQGTIRRQCFEACQLAARRFLREQLRPATGVCDATTEQLCRATRQQLSALAQRRLAQHLRWCRACRSRARELAELTGSESALRVVAG